MEDAVDTEKTEQEKKPIIDHMTDLAAKAAGTLAETAVKALATFRRKIGVLGIVADDARKTMTRRGWPGGC